MPTAARKPRPRLKPLTLQQTFAWIAYQQLIAANAGKLERVGIDFGKRGKSQQWPQVWAWVFPAEGGWRVNVHFEEAGYRISFRKSRQLSTLTLDYADPTKSLESILSRKFKLKLLVRDRPTDPPPGYKHPESV